MQIMSIMFKYDLHDEQFSASIPLLLHVQQQCFFCYFSIFFIAQVAKVDDTRLVHFVLKRSQMTCQMPLFMVTCTELDEENLC